MSKINNFTIGSDPELLIKDIKSGKYISSIGIIPGEKNKAVQMEGLPDGFKCQIDNVLGEYNIPPVKTKEEFIKAINDAKNWFNTYLRPKGLMIECNSSAVYDNDQLEHKLAQEIGCDPDINCWTEQLNIKPEKFLDGRRTVGTHIHIGYDNPNEDSNFDLACAMDIMLGVPSIIIDKDEERRKYYGKSGSFRHQKWGMEYRVLSGLFTSSDKLLSWVWDQTMKAIELVETDDKHSYLSLGDTVQDIINSGDAEKAKEFCAKMNIKLPE